MSSPLSHVDNTGLYVVDADASPELLARPLRPRSIATQVARMERIAQAFVSDSGTLLQELVEAAVELCGADSAGISIEREDATEKEFYHWVATAGEYSAFTNAILPRYPSACGVCLERGCPQFFQVGQRFFDIMGISAPLVHDGILLPWVVDKKRGTIFIMSHSEANTFDSDDVKVMQMLANFAAMAVRQQQLQRLHIEQAKLAASTRLANELAHSINNPLQCLTNILFLASEGHYGEEARAVGDDATPDLERLSTLVRQLLTLSAGADRAHPGQASSIGAFSLRDAPPAAPAQPDSSRP